MNKSMNNQLYRIRMNRMDRKKCFNAFQKDDDGRWVTTENGHKVHLNAEGDPDKGNPHVIDKILSGDKKIEHTRSRRVNVWNSLTKKQKTAAEHYYYGFEFRKGYAEVTKDPYFGISPEKMASAWEFMNPEYEFNYKVETEKGNIWTNFAPIVHHRIYRTKKKFE